MFQGSKGCFKKISRVFQRSFREISRGVKESSMGVQVRLKGISSSFKGVLRVFEKSSTGVSGKFQWRFKEVFQEVLRKIQGCFKKVSRVFQDNSKED